MLNYTSFNFQLSVAFHSTWLTSAAVHMHPREFVPVKCGSIVQRKSEPPLWLNRIDVEALTIQQVLLLGPSRLNQTGLLFKIRVLDLPAVHRVNEAHSSLEGSSFHARSCFTMLVAECR